MGSAPSARSPMSVSQAAYDNSRHGLRKVAAAGLLTGVLTPLFQPLIDKIAGSPGDLRIALLALPFAILIFILVRRNAANPWWAAFAAAVLTMLAFVCAVNAAIWIDGQLPGATKPVRNIFAGFTGGFVGSGLMALGLCLLPTGPRDVTAWLRGWRWPCSDPISPDSTSPNSRQQGFRCRSRSSFSRSRFVGSPPETGF